MKESDKKKNVLFVFADQMHAFAMGCMGNGDIDTPNLDRLAEQGTLFENCYSCNAVCTPFRAALVTGRYSSQTGILNNAPKPIPRGERTIADCLNDAGTHTSYVGKWHICGSGNVWIPPELRGGFKDFIGYQCYNDFLNDIGFFDEEGEKHVVKKHRLEATTDIAIERMEKIRDRRFAMFVSYQCPHYPVQPSEEYADGYWNRNIKVRPNFREVENPFSTPGEAYRWEDGPAYLMKGSDTVSYIKMYYAIISQMDEQIGRMMNKLEEWGIADNTLVVFTSDHGDMQGSHGLKNKHVYYEESTRCPLIVRNPEAPRGQRIRNHIGTADFLPTILDWCGSPPSPMAEGKSVLPLTMNGTWDKKENITQFTTLRAFTISDGLLKNFREDLDAYERLHLGRVIWPVFNTVFAKNFVLDQYSLVVIAGAVNTDMELRDKLLAFVKSGGHLVVTAANAVGLFPEWRIGQAAEKPAGRTVVWRDGTRTRESEPIRLCPASLPKAAEITATCGGVPAVAGIRMGKGRITLLLSSHGISEKPAVAGQVRIEEEKPIPCPHALLAHVRRALSEAFAEQQMFRRKSLRSLARRRKIASSRCAASAT